MRFKLFIVQMFIIGFTGCSYDPAGTTQTADPKNCKTPCVQTVPIFDKTTIDGSTGDTITMTLNIVGDASAIDSTTLQLLPLSVAAGVLAHGTCGVDDAVAGTYTANFVINAGSITGEYYPAIYIYVAGTEVNGVSYHRNTVTSNTHYAFEEFVNGDGSSFTSNGTYVGYALTDIAIPIITLQ